MAYTSRPQHTVPRGVRTRKSRHAVRVPAFCSGFLACCELCVSAGCAAPAVMPRLCFGLLPDCYGVGLRGGDNGDAVAIHPCQRAGIRADGVTAHVGQVHHVRVIEVIRPIAEPDEIRVSDVRWDVNGSRDFAGA